MAIIAASNCALSDAMQACFWCTSQSSLSVHASLYMHRVSVFDHRESQNQSDQKSHSCVYVCVCVWLFECVYEFPWAVGTDNAVPVIRSCAVRGEGDSYYMYANRNTDEIVQCWTEGVLYVVFVSLCSFTFCSKNNRRSKSLIWLLSRTLDRCFTGQRINANELLKLEPKCTVCKDFIMWQRLEWNWDIEKLWKCRYSHNVRCFPIRYYLHRSENTIENIDKHLEYCRWLHIL